MKEFIICEKKLIYSSEVLGKTMQKINTSPHDETKTKRFYMFIITVNYDVWVKNA